MVVSIGMSPGASAISDIPFMLSISHDGFASGMYQKPDIPTLVTFLNGLQKIGKS